MNLPSRGVFALVLAGGKGERLFPLTKHRSKPAVPFGGKFRLVDIPLSNCLRAVYALAGIANALIRKCLETDEDSVAAALPCQPHQLLYLRSTRQKDPDL